MHHLLPVVDSICKHPEHFVDYEPSHSSLLLVDATKSLYYLSMTTPHHTTPHHTTPHHTTPHHITSHTNATQKPSISPHISLIAKKYEPKKSNALESLLLDGFDQEQIWEQLQLLNLPILQHADQQIATMSKRPASTTQNELYQDGSAAKKYKVRILLCSFS